MSTHLVFFGPSTAGKTSLMLGLSQSNSECKFNIDRTWTSRPQRPNETAEENVFVNSRDFDAHHNKFLFTFATFPTYKYGIEIPHPLGDNELRMRILMPRFARLFRQLVPEPTIFCAILPLASDPEALMIARDPSVDPFDVAARLARFKIDTDEAQATADISFKNTYGLDNAIAALRSTVCSYAISQRLLILPAPSI
jgi:hypothetical protein